MKVAFLLFFLITFFSYGQKGVDVYILDCSTLTSKEAKKECTDEIILNQIGENWDTIRTKVLEGVYFIEYTIYSNGKAEAKTIKRVPSIADPNNSIDVLKAVVDSIINKHEWQLPIKVQGIVTGSSQYLKVNTSRF